MHRRSTSDGETDGSMAPGGAASLMADGDSGGGAGGVKSPATICQAADRRHEIRRAGGGRGGPGAVPWPVAFLARRHHDDGGLPGRPLSMGADQRWNGTAWKRGAAAAVCAAGERAEWADRDTAEPDTGVRAGAGRAAWGAGRRAESCALLRRRPKLENTWRLASG